jgi:hypothetical protein
MKTILSKFSLMLFFAILTLVFAPLGSLGPMDVSASEDDEMVKDELIKEDIEELDEDLDEDVDKKDIKVLEDKVKLVREDLEKKMEKRLAEMFKDEEMMDALSRLQEAEEELAMNGGDSWFARPFAPRPFSVRQPQFFPGFFNPFRVRPFFFFDEDDDVDFFRRRFFDEDEDD